jgi:hypothetical protein
VNRWPAIAALFLTGCGARTGLYAPLVDEVKPGPPPSYCQGMTDPVVYVVTDRDELLRFDPPGASFASVGPLDCPVVTPGASAYSMAVDHLGTAYIVFDDGELFTASTASASCSAPSSPIDVGAFSATFGMGFSADAGGQGETLYLSGDTIPGELGTLDTGTFTVDTVGTFTVDIGRAELTGTGDGRLFGFGVGVEADGSDLAELDKGTAAVLSDTVVGTPPHPMAWAFAFWGGDFYFFTSVDGISSTVGRFHPADGSFDPAYATLSGGAITGAGVTTCAPR